MKSLTFSASLVMSGDDATHAGRFKNEDPTGEGFTPVEMGIFLGALRAMTDQAIEESRRCFDGQGEDYRKAFEASMASPHVADMVDRGYRAGVLARTTQPGILTPQ